MKANRKAAIIARKHRSSCTSTSMQATSGGRRQGQLQLSAARQASSSAAKVTATMRHPRNVIGVTTVDDSSTSGSRSPDGALPVSRCTYDDRCDAIYQHGSERMDAAEQTSERVVTSGVVDRAAFAVGNSSNVQKTSIFDALVKLKASDGVRTNDAELLPPAAAATGTANQPLVAPTTAPNGRNGNQHWHYEPHGRPTLSWSRDASSIDTISCSTLVCIRSSFNDNPFQRQTPTLDANCFDVIQKTTEKAANTVLVTIFLAMFTTVPLAMACIGVKHLDDCPIQPNIPVYLFVGGCFGLLKVLSILWRQVRSRRFNTMDEFIDDDDNEQSGVHTGSSVTGRGVGGGILVSRSSRFSELVLSAFLVIWFVCGNCWVLSVNRPISFKQQLVSPSSWCDRTVYTFAFVQIIASYVIGATAILLAVLITVCHKALSLYKQ